MCAATAIVSSVSFVAAGGGLLYAIRGYRDANRNYRNAKVDLERAIIIVRGDHRDHDGT